MYWPIKVKINGVFGEFVYLYAHYDFAPIVFSLYSFIPKFTTSCPVVAWIVDCLYLDALTFFKYNIANNSHIFCKVTAAFKGSCLCYCGWLLFGYVLSSGLYILFISVTYA